MPAEISAAGSNPVAGGGVETIIQERIVYRESENKENSAELEEELKLKENELRSEQEEKRALQEKLESLQRHFSRNPPAN